MKLAHILEISMAAAAIWAGSTAWGQAASRPASGPGESATSQPATLTMKFQFADTPVETILNEISARLGVEIDRAAPVPGRVTIIVPQAVDAPEALRLLNALLADQRYTAIPIDRTNADGTPRLAVRVGTIDDAKKGAIPVN